ncbi:PREDICTED: classical arabinogalactan [Prunus dulcis]|uniref:PREDICTED: classical arabinogalactan n=1 Tax=Prunus dulcis TaxID=3755 RepID=A0A5E4EME9_PRUDU|nr:classical arabinogalactan protein 26 [Prunus dulcis]VVA16864.1 PREDICTED: classical arabinogalactan [Prunus dulcis]
MASFWSHIVFLIMAFMASPLLSLHSKASSASSSISASPAFLITNLPPSSLQELPPEIAPLLPSPGPVVPATPTDSSIPTIPSNPSPPNPDDLVSPGPYSSLSPFGSLPASSAASISLIWPLKLAAFAGSAAYVVYAAY